MNSESWISKIKLRKKQKQEMKMREKFSFLLDEMIKSENRVIEQFTDEIEHRLLPHLDETIQTINSSFDDAANIIQKSNNNLQEKVTELIESSESNYKVTLEMIQSIISKIEEAESDISKKQKHTESTVRNNTKNIMLSIDEVKSLLKILAVNNLLDDIDTEKIEC